MRGGVFHEMILDRLENACLSKGLRVARQVACCKGEGTGYRYIDMLVRSDKSDGQLLIEVEMDSPRRVMGDLLKRRDVGEHAILWIVTPTQRLARLIRKRLQNLEIEPREQIWVPAYFAALRRLENKNPFCSPVIEEQKGKGT